MATANATVMFTDIRGFTARTSRDTRVGLEELLRTHEQLLLPVIKHYDGRVVKTIGDAFLVVFESPTNAVHCGVVIQKRLREFNGAVPEEKKIEVRVAINSGEVALRGDDIFGEPVNIAARIEGITEAGEVYFTEATYLAMTKSEVPSSEVGTRRLKGIPEEIKLYKVLQDEDNALYKRILETATLAEHTAAATGSLSVPQWPPRRGRLQPGRGSGIMLLAWVAGAAVVAGAYIGTQAWREAHRYDQAEALLAAKQWREARTEAGRLFNERGEDNRAVTLLGQAITGELAALEAAGDLRALQDAWTTVTTGYPSLRSLPALERQQKLAAARVRVRTGDTPTALDALTQMHEADKGDAEVLETLTTALRADCAAGVAALEPKNRDAFHKRFEAHAERWKGLPGWPAIQADTWFEAGCKLITVDNGWVQQQAEHYLDAFLRVEPADHPRRSEAIARLMAAGRFGDWTTLAAALDADPTLAARTEVRDALLDWIAERYDLDGKEWTAARTLLATHWGAAVHPTIRPWLDAPANPNDSSEHVERRCAAFVILGEAGALTDAERDRHLAWVLLQMPGSSWPDELLGALRHWQGLLAADREAAGARAAAAVPAPLDRLDGLHWGDWEKDNVDHGAAWRSVVSAAFYPQARARLQAEVTAGSLAERSAARKLLAEHGDLPDALAAASHVRALEHFGDRSYPYELEEALAWLQQAPLDAVADPAALRAALTEVLAILDEKIAGIEQSARLSGSEKRREVEWWRKPRAAAAAVAERFAGG